MRRSRKGALGVPAALVASGCRAQSMRQSRLRMPAALGDREHRQRKPSAADNLSADRQLVGGRLRSCGRAWQSAPDAAHSCGARFARTCRTSRRARADPTSGSQATFLDTPAPEAPQEVEMTRIWLRTILFSILGALVFVLVADNSADACHRRHRNRCNGCSGGYAYQGKYSGAYYRGSGAYYGGTYGAPVAPYGAESNAPGVRSARGTIEGGAAAGVDGTLRSPSDRVRAGAGADVEGRTDVEGAGARARVRARGDAGTPPPPPTDESTLPPPRSERPAEPPSPPRGERPAEPPATPDET